MITNQEQRAERFHTACWVALDEDNVCVTKDISTTGVYFISDKVVQEGIVVKFFILMKKLGEIVSRLRCEGRVVRADQSQGGWGVAINFTTFEFECVA